MIQAMQRIDFPTPIRPLLHPDGNPAKRLDYVTFPSAVRDTKTLGSG
jgi:hypothetical protein